MFSRILLLFVLIVTSAHLAVNAADTARSADKHGLSAEPLSQVDYELVGQLRLHAAQHGDCFQIAPCGALRPKAQELLSYLKGLDSVDAAWLEAYLSVGEPNAAILLALAIKSVHTAPSADERELFSHIPGWERLNKIVGASSMETLVAALISYGPYLKIRSSIGSDLIHEVALFLNAQVGPIPYALLGKSKLPFKDLLTHMLNGVYPICVPQPGSTHRAHGAPLSSLAFALHDFVHAHDNINIEALLGHILLEAEKAVERGEDAKPFIDEYKIHAVRRHILITDFLKEFLHEAVRQDTRRGKQAVAGLFLALHEHRVSSSSVYATHSLKEVVQTIANLSIRRLEHEQSWESPYDLLETSPTDGSSALNDDAITQKVLAAFYENPDCILPESYYHLKLEDRLVRLKELVAGIVVTRSPRFIDVGIRLKNGEIKNYIFPTLLHKLMNMSDSAAILKYASVAAPKSQDASRRQDALDALTAARTELRKLIEAFSEAAGKFAVDRGWELSYAEHCENL